MIESTESNIDQVAATALLNQIATEPLDIKRKKRREAQARWKRNNPEKAHLNNKRWRDKNIEKRRTAENERAKKKYENDYYTIWARNSRWRKANPKKVNAATMAHRAKIPMTACSRCGSDKNLLRHHPNYDRPLDVIILCKACHSWVHVNHIVLPEEWVVHGIRRNKRKHDGCKEAECKRPHYGHGFCQKHYSEIYLPLLPKQKCEVEWCQVPAHTRRMCDRHYMQWRQFSKKRVTPFKTPLDRDFKIVGTNVEITLWTRLGTIQGKVLINLEDKDKILKYGWNVNPDGYARNNLVGQMSRYILNLPRRETESSPLIDHINHDRLDNRRENLRIVDRLANARNHKLDRRNKSGVTGVKYDEKRNRWTASIMVNRKHVHLGRFLMKEDAISARKTAEKKLWRTCDQPNISLTKINE